jgi:large-conductance mechanosensitive channel
MVIIMNKEKNRLLHRTSVFLRSAAKTSVIVAIVFLFLKWFGNLLEVMCNYVNISWGIFLICVIVTGVIYMDSKNAIEAGEQPQKREPKAHCHQK